MSIIVVSAISVLVGAVVFASLGVRASRRVSRAARAVEGHDRLTGLRDRDALRDRIARLAGGNRATVLLLEFDHLDRINEIYGHQVGDELLRALVDQLVGLLAGGEELFRYSGPQFAIVAPSVTTTAAATERATSLRDAVQHRYNIRHDNLRVSATVAAVVLDQRHKDVTTVERDLVAAIEEGRQRGAGSVVVHEIAMNQRLVPLQAERRLREALERDEFTLLYMPVIDLADNTVAGVEALLRWIDPTRGLVAPGEFLTVLEQSDLLGPVTDWVLRAACRDAKRWSERFPQAELMITINMSPGQLLLPELDNRFMAILLEERVDPRRLCLEITEGDYGTEAERTWAALRTIKDTGVQLALDDFGTGSSTFAYLRRFKLDVLKIDRLFVQAADTSAEDFAVLQQLVALAHSLDYVAIAEGVDTEAQLEALISADCDLAQGYLWTQPVTREAVDTMVEKGALRPVGGRRPGIDWSAPAAR